MNNEIFKKTSFPIADELLKIKENIIINGVASYRDDFITLELGAINNPYMLLKDQITEEEYYKLKKYYNDNSKNIVYHIFINLKPYEYIIKFDNNICFRMLVDYEFVEQILNRLSIVDLKNYLSWDEALKVFCLNELSKIQ